ncbi:MAG: HDIG domain-containing protein [Saprospiraceae bacterium]
METKVIQDMQPKPDQSETPNLPKGLSRAPFALIAAAIFAFMVTNRSVVQYDFTLGKSWAYDDLDAPFSFPILKDPVAISQEEKAIEASFLPFYRLRFDSTGWEAFKDSLAVKSVNNPLLPLRILQKVDSLRHIGIYQADQSLPDGMIQIVNHDVIIKTWTTSLLSSERAVQIAAQWLPRGEPAEYWTVLLKQVLKPNVFYDPEETDRQKNFAVAQIPETEGLIVRGQRVVSKGEIITPALYQTLLSFEQASNNKFFSQARAWEAFAGFWMASSLVLLLLIYYLYAYEPEIFRRPRTLLLFMVWPLLYTLLVILIERNGLSSYLVPFAIVPIVLVHFFNLRLAIIIHLITVLMASLASKLGFEFMLIHIVAGITAAFRLQRTRSLNEFFFAIIWVGAVISLMYVALTLIKQGMYDVADWIILIWLGVGTFLTLIAYPLIPIVGRLIGQVSAITLIDLADLNHPLLRALSVKAPGTLQHSLQVANLAETAGKAIGAQSDLLKTAAYFHDIGKMEHPEYFIENQLGGNPHDLLTPEESAKIIMGHVPEGVRLAEKEYLPRVLVDFIRTHHGTTMTRYFFVQRSKETPGEANASDFTYPGPKPRTKEEGILMLADSIEAAARSLPDPIPEKLNELVDQIIKSKIEQGQLVDTPLTFKDLERCSQSFKQNLQSIYHQRVPYE